MTRDHILARINTIFIETLDNKELKISEDTRASDINEWDSLMHILLVDAIEEEFSVRFKSSEIQNWKNIGQIIDTITTETD